MSEVDLVALRAVIDRLETETAEATAAKEALESARISLESATSAVDNAITVYEKENDDRLAVTQEAIALLQAGLGS